MVTVNMVKLATSATRWLLLPLILLMRLLEIMGLVVIDGLNLYSDRFSCQNMTSVDVRL